MAAASIIAGVTDYFMNCPLLQDGVFRVEALADSPVEYAIETGIFNPVITQYVNGDSERQFQFNFTSREYYSMDRLQNIQNTEFYENLADWVEKQDRAEDYPELPEGCSPLSMEVMSPGYIYDASMRNARYQIQMRLTYYKEVEN